MPTIASKDTRMARLFRWRRFEPRSVPMQNRDSSGLAPHVVLRHNCSEFNPYHPYPSDP